MSFVPARFHAMKQTDTLKPQDCRLHNIEASSKQDISCWVFVSVSE